MGKKRTLTPEEMGDVGSLIRNFREKRGLTQEEAAAEIGMKSPSYFSGIERGARRVSAKKAVELLMRLEPSPEGLLEIFGLGSLVPSIGEELMLGLSTTGEGLRARRERET